MVSIGLLCAQALYLFSPLIVASILAGYVQHYDTWKALKRPIDAGTTFRGSRVFGDNKTWRGVACSVIGSIIGVLGQKYMIADHAGAFAVIDYARVNAFVLGVALGGGASLGELPNSFVKRRLGIAPGAQSQHALAFIFYLWDQVDVLTVTWPLLLFWYTPSWPLVLTSFLLAPAAHQTLSIIGYLIGARRSAV